MSNSLTSTVETIVHRNLCNNTEKFRFELEKKKKKWRKFSLNSKNVFYWCWLRSIEHDVNMAWTIKLKNIWWNSNVHLKIEKCLKIENFVKQIKIVYSLLKKPSTTLWNRFQSKLTDLAHSKKENFWIIKMVHLAYDVICGDLSSFVDVCPCPNLKSNQTPTIEQPAFAISLLTPSIFICAMHTQTHTVCIVCNRFNN